MFTPTFRVDFRGIGVTVLSQLKYKLHMLSCRCFFFLLMKKQTTMLLQTRDKQWDDQLAQAPRVHKTNTINLPCTAWQIWLSPWRRHGHYLSLLRCPEYLNLIDFELGQVRTTCIPHTARPCWTRRTQDSSDLARIDARQPETGDSNILCCRAAGYEPGLFINSEF